MMKIIKKPFDPVATRISLGGRPDMGNYMVYRGSPGEIKAILKQALQVVDMLIETGKEPEIDGKEYMG